MKSSTPHEIVVGLVVFFLGLAIVKSWGWLSKLLYSWDDRRVLSNLKEMETEPTLYADKMMRRHRMLFGIAGYLACCDLVISQMGWDNMKVLKIMLAGAAGLCALRSGSAGSVSTAIGVKRASKGLREWLRKKGKLPKEEQQPPDADQRQTN